jgi:hypothetical protein
MWGSLVFGNGVYEAIKSGWRLSHHFKNRNESRSREIALNPFLVVPCELPNSARIEIREIRFRDAEAQFVGVFFCGTIGRNLT